MIKSWKTIEGRGEAGHWEGDLIICKRTRPVLVLHVSESHTGHARRVAHREKRRRNHLSDARGVRPYRSSSAKINHLRQRHRLRPARPAQDHARYDDLVLRRLCLIAKRRHRKRQWTLTSMAATPPGYRSDIRPGYPGDRPHDQPHASEMPRVQDAIPSLDCRAWKGRSNPLLLSTLRFAPESRAEYTLSQGAHQ